MATATSKTVIQRPVDKVFAYVVDVHNHLAWQAGIKDARVEPQGPVGLGSTYHYTSEVMGMRMQTAMRVSGFEPNKRWAVTTTNVPRPVETVYAFEPDGANTRLTISMELSGGYPAAAEAAVMAQMQKSLNEQGLRIKGMLEK